MNPFRALPGTPRLLLGLLLALSAGRGSAATPQLQVSADHRYLTSADGHPFFYLGDTAWELFHRLNREEAQRYLEDRASKGFNVVQAVVLAEEDGLHTPNAYGHTPLVQDDPTQPNEKYFEHVDWVVAKANQLGLYIGLLPTWGDKWNKGGGVGPEIFTPENARAYGEWLGRRYRNAGLIWILGGDRAVQTNRHRDILFAMAQGLKAGDQGKHLVTLHPRGGQGSSQYFPDAPWLDFHMRQNGHGLEFTGHYDQTRVDYERQPRKPVLDGEPIYEDHPVAFAAARLGYSTAADVRRAFYWDTFSGACGHTYGHHAVWQMFDPAKRQPVNQPLLPWYEALHQPGAGQMQLGKRLLEARPFYRSVPEEALLVPDKVTTAVPGAGTRAFLALREKDGAWAMVYAPLGRAFKVRMSRISGSAARAWWFNPRTGTATEMGQFPCVGESEFTPPEKGELLDYVLVLDDLSQPLPPPGAAPAASAK